jgi:hypothetical protein
MADQIKSPDDYKPTLPAGFENLKIDVSDARYLAARKLAHESG